MSEYKTEVKKENKNFPTWKVLLLMLIFISIFISGFRIYFQAIGGFVLWMNPHIPMGDWGYENLWIEIVELMTLILSFYFVWKSKLLYDAEVEKLRK